MRRLLLGLVASTLLVGCTERLVAPGSCPPLCPGGVPEFRDTVLTAVVGGDSSFTGYTSFTDGASLLLSNGGPLGDARAVIQFIRRGDSVFAGDSLKPFTIDSVVLSVVLQARDTTATGLKIDVYRLPATFDSLSSFAELDAAMVPAQLLKTIDVADAARSGVLTMSFVGAAELAKLAFVPSDSTRLVLGLRLRANSPAGAYLGGLASGSSTPLYLTYTRVDLADTTRNRPILQRGVQENFTQFQGVVAPHPDLLRIGGWPAGRVLIRFPFPEYLRDSATIVRATLELTPEVAALGIPGDSARVDARILLADFGAKSVVDPSTGASAWVRPGTDTLRLDVAPLVARWQGDPDMPSAVRLGLGQEHASFLAPVFRSTRSAGTGPRLRITYRLPYGVRAF